MKNKVKRSGFTPQEHLISLLPAVIVGIVLSGATIASSLTNFQIASPVQGIWLVLCGSLYIFQIIFYYIIHDLETGKLRWVWTNALFAAAILCIWSYFLPKEINHLIYALVFISALSASLLASRGPAHVLLFGVVAFQFIINLSSGLPLHELITHLGLAITVFVGIETVQQLRNIALLRIKRLEVINELSRQIASTLETKQVFALLNAAIQNALEADAYYVATLHDDQLHLELLYDDGEYFQDVWIDKKGTLCNWIITHQQGLFLPNLRDRIELDDVEVVTVGKDNKPTLSWMGVSMRASHVEGAIAISSYRPYAFDRSDMDLLQNIAQRAALALDNAHHHAFVEKQAQLDSLTEVYNHGYFIKTIQEQAQTCREQNQPLSLIMLDIDYFKHYNDRFGHLIGDEVLISLCNVIRQHVKSTDAVGRWGGEEFCVSLPNASKEQAVQVAQRIRETMASLKIKNAEQLTIPLPTVSQGIAVFPAETDDITSLIDLADKRLYVAKNRGRDQIETVSTEA
ncbi:MAG: GGDEF domain-containing protein [Chloroflexi bacterium]|nr:GGDEF domain-containing protein [Chloroflexota bacterium]